MEVRIKEKLARRENMRPLGSFDQKIAIFRKKTIINDFFACFLEKNGKKVW